MTVGLYGGSFNPPHLAHLVVAETARDRFGFDRVLWMPSHQPPHKQGQALAAPAHRLAMTRRAVRGHPAFDVSDLELARGGTSYTVDTLRVLQEAHPGTTFVLLLGGDSLRSFATWHRPQEILDRVPLCVYRRAGEGAERLPLPLRGDVRFVEAPRLDISSTDLRARVAHGRSIRYLVPEAVRAYIEEHGLYRS